MPEAVTIRSAKPEDAKRLLEIYSYYVKNTAVSFEYAVPSPAEFRARVKKTLARYPYLVLEEGGKIWGYTYAGPFQSRAAYQWSCEASIYLDPAARRRGFGKRLYQALEARLKEMGVLNLYACIACPAGEDAYLDRNSLEFHAHLGFAPVGTFHQCGYKFGHWYHMVWMEKAIGEHIAAQPPVKFPA